MKRAAIFCFTCLVLLTAGCAARYRDVRVPPRIDLSQHQIIAVVEFDASNEGELGPMATRRFTDLARRDQGLVRMMNVSPEETQHDPEAYRKIGERHGARTVLVGTLDVSDVKPNVSISKTLRSGSLTANVDATLTVDLIEIETGASIWSASARARRTVGHINVFDGRDVTFDASDPEDAYGDLIDTLVAQVTSDFRATWRREPIPR